MARSLGRDPLVPVDPGRRSSDGSPGPPPGDRSCGRMARAHVSRPRPGRGDRETPARPLLRHPPCGAANRGVPSHRRLVLPGHPRLLGGDADARQLGPASDRRMARPVFFRQAGPDRPRGVLGDAIIHRRAALWAAGAAAAGMFFALGRFNPAGSWLFSAGGGILRYPVKFFLPVAAGGALLAGLGFEAAMVAPEPRVVRAFRAGLAALA